jgi:hypothetical protein
MTIIYVRVKSVTFNALLTYKLSIFNCLRVRFFVYLFPLVCFFGSGFYLE